MQCIEWEKEPIFIPAHAGYFVGDLMDQFQGLRILVPHDFWAKLPVARPQQPNRKLLLGRVSADEDRVPTIARAIDEIDEQGKSETVGYTIIADHILEIAKSEQGLDEGLTYCWISGEEDRASEWHTSLVSLLYNDSGGWRIVVQDYLDVDRILLPRGGQLTILF